MNLDLEGNRLRAARILFGWNLSDLAARSGISEFTLKHLEKLTASQGGTTVKAVLKAFTDAGIEFPPRGRGVSLRDNPENPRAIA